MCKATANVLQLLSRDGTCFIQLSGSFEEAWQRGLQHHDKVFQLFCYSDQHVFVHQVVFSLLQGPLAAHVPAQRSHMFYVDIFSYCVTLLKRGRFCQKWRGRENWKDTKTETGRMIT